MDKKKASSVLTTVLLIIMGGGVGFSAAKMGMEAAKSVPTSQIITLALLFIPAFFLVVGVHEAGHAVAGSWVNFDFRMYVVGPLMWTKQHSQWVFKWNKNVNLLGGMVISLPTSSDNLGNRFSIYAMGGPMASLLLAGVAYGLYMFASLAPFAKSFALQVSESLLFIISFQSSVIFLLTIVPFRTGGFYSDGARALRFMRGGDTSRYEVLLMKIITSSSGGIRPRLLNQAELQEALDLGKKIEAPTKLFIEYYNYQSALDKGDYDEAESSLKKYLDEMNSIPEGFRSAVFLDAAFYYAFARRDLTVALSYWEQFKPSAVIPKASVLAAEAAILHLQHDAPARNLKIDSAIQEIPNMLDQGVGLALQEKLLSMKEGKE